MPAGVVSGLLPLRELPDHPRAPARDPCLAADPGPTPSRREHGPLVGPLRTYVGSDPAPRPAEVHPSRGRARPQRARTGHARPRRRPVGTLVTLAARACAPHPAEDDLVLAGRP